MASSDSSISALLRICKVAVQVSGRAVVYVAALGAVAILASSDPHTAATLIAGNLGFNLLAAILDRVSRNEPVSDEEIRETVQQAIEKSGIDRLLTADEFQRTIARLVRQQNLLGYAIQQQEYKTLDALLDQFTQYKSLSAELQSQIQSLQVDLQGLATREQSEEILTVLHRIEQHFALFASQTTPKWDGILSASQAQVARGIALRSRKFSSDLYVPRQADAVFDQFCASKSVCLVIVDRAGSGKTNMACFASSKLSAQGRPVVLLRGDSTLLDDYGWTRIVGEELGIPTMQSGGAIPTLRAIAQGISEHKEKLCIVIDGVSESDDLDRATRALSNFLLEAAQIGAIQVCITCRDVVWPTVSYALPNESLYYSLDADLDNSTLQKEAHQLQVGDFTDAELQIALPLYQQKYQVSFQLNGVAREHAKHPLLLRLFCEANQGAALGFIENLPRSTTYDHYLAAKTTAIEARSAGQYTHIAVLAALTNMAGTLRAPGKNGVIRESDIQTILPPMIPPQYGQQLISMLEEEGVVTIHESRLGLDRTLRFVFDELQDYLYVRHLISQLPPELTQGDPDVASLGLRLLQRFPASMADENTFRLLQLIGILQPEVDARQQFLIALLEWDFQTFCACLSYISPAGHLATNELRALRQLAGEMLSWYGRFATSHFAIVKPQIDPWNRAYNLGQTCEVSGIHLQASPECKEVSYWYRCCKTGEEPLEVIQSRSYPTWNLSFLQGDKTIELHDPEHGLMISILRSGPNNTTQRTIDFAVRLPYPGASLNVPERIALFDAAGEIDNLLLNGPMPFEPIPMIVERAKAIARHVNSLVLAPELSLQVFLPQIPRLLAQYPTGSMEYALIESDLYKLELLLGRLAGPLGDDYLPPGDKSTQDGVQRSESQYSERALREYLGHLFSMAISCYKGLVESNFPNHIRVLTTYAQIPSNVLVITDRRHIKYAWQPVDNDEEARINCIISTDFDIGDPRLSLAIESMPFEQYVSGKLRQLGKQRPPIHPVEKTLPIDFVFSSTPINDLVVSWLRSDFRDLFGF